ncbi:MAG: hypothetical protein N3A58_08525 [Spirochaetes bacterium]|nr:hypothetical protein [Spirochaetota bacterium]
MLKKSIILVGILSLFLIYSCNFNIFRPKNLGDIVKNLPKEEQLSIAEEALGNVQSPSEAASIRDSLIQSWSSDLSNGAQTEQEAQAAYLIAQATVLSDPILFEAYNLIQQLASGQSVNGNSLGSFFSNLSNDPNALENAIAAISNAATYLNYAAEYNQNSSQLNPGMQILNALFNIIKHVDSQIPQGQWTNETVVQNAFNSIDFSNPASGALQDAKDSLQAIINSPNVSDSLKQIAQSLLGL